MKCVSLMLLVAASMYGQGQPAATRDELEYLRFLLISVASIDHDPKAATTFENLLVRQFGLNSQESGAIHTAGLELKTLLTQSRQTARTIIPGPTGLSVANSAVLTALSSQREQRIEVLANRILNQVRPQIAERLRKPGREIAEKKRAVTR
jgi:hypothetical protein